MLRHFVRSTTYILTGHYSRGILSCLLGHLGVLLGNLPMTKLSLCALITVPNLFLENAGSGYCYIIAYRIAGKFGEVFTLANWQVCGKSPNIAILCYVYAIGIGRRQI